VGPYAFSPQLLRSRCNDALNGSIKPPGGKNGRDGEASTFLAEGAQPDFGHDLKKCKSVLVGTGAHDYCIHFANPASLHKYILVVLVLVAQEDKVAYPTYSSDSRMLTVFANRPVCPVACLMEAMRGSREAPAQPAPENTEPTNSRITSTLASRRCTTSVSPALSPPLLSQWPSWLPPPWTSRP
jgi:hypothetical protein